MDALKGELLFIRWLRVKFVFFMAEMFCKLTRAEALIGSGHAGLGGKPL